MVVILYQNTSPLKMVVVQLLKRLVLYSPHWLVNFTKDDDSKKGWLCSAFERLSTQTLMFMHLKSH